MELLKFLNNINDVEENIRSFTGVATFATPDGDIISTVDTNITYRVGESSTNQLSVNSESFFATAGTPLRTALSVTDEFRSEIVDIIRTTIREEIVQTIRETNSITFNHQFEQVNARIELPRESDP